MYAYIHPACRQPAYLMADKPEPAIAFLGVRLYDLNNAPLPPGSGHTCCSCGGDMFGQAADIGNVVNHILWKQENSHEEGNLK